jgi:hypothetical protein
LLCGLVFLRLALFLSIWFIDSLKSPPNIGIPVPYSFKIELTFLKNAFLAVVLKL